MIRLSNCCRLTKSNVSQTIPSLHSPSPNIQIVGLISDENDFMVFWYKALPTACANPLPRLPVENKIPRFGFLQGCPKKSEPSTSKVLVISSMDPMPDSAIKEYRDKHAWPLDNISDCNLWEDEENEGGAAQ